MQIKLKNVRLSFPDLYKARANPAEPTSTPKFGASFLLHKTRNAPEIAAIEGAIKALCAEKKWTPKMLKSVCLVDASSKVNSKTGEPLDGYDSDHMVVSARAVRKPPTWNSDGTEVGEADNVIYAGCYVHAMIDIFPYDKVPAHGKRICAGLVAVRFARDGEPFGAGVPKDASCLSFEEDDAL